MPTSTHSRNNKIRWKIPPKTIDNFEQSTEFEMGPPVCQTWQL